MSLPVSSESKKAESRDKPVLNEPTALNKMAAVSPRTGQSARSACRVKLRPARPRFLGDADFDRSL